MVREPVLGVARFAPWLQVAGGKDVARAAQLLENPTVQHYLDSRVFAQQVQTLLVQLPPAAGTCVKAPQTDWASGLRGCITWGIPAAVLIVSPVQYFAIVWPAVLTFMGVACWLNARRCGRVHCYVTGPFFLLLALVGLLYGLGVVPLGARGWSMLSIALVVGSVVLVYVPEWLFGRYRASRIR